MSEAFNDDTLKKTAENGASTVTPDDMDKVLQQEDTFQKKAGKIEKLLDQFKLTWSLIKDYKNGNYRDISWTTIAAFTFAVLYLLSPIDLVPDFIPILGLTDDAALFALTLKSFGQDLERYKKWKESQKE